jgi:hypothetical protein
MAIIHENGAIKVVCEGVGAKLPEQSQAIADNTFKLEGLDARSIQLYLAYRLAQALNFTLAFSADGEKIELAAQPKTSG